jgi:hypothetical protein
MAEGLEPHHPRPVCKQRQRLRNFLTHPVVLKTCQTARLCSVTVNSTGSKDTSLVDRPARATSKSRATPAAT